MIVPHTDEALWLYDEPVAENETRTWHGPAPRLSTHDGAGSYGRISPGNLPLTQYAGAAARLAPFTWPAEGIRIRAQVRYLGDWVDDFIVNGYFAIVVQTLDYRWIQDWNVAGADNPTDFWEYRTSHDPAYPGWELLDFTPAPNGDAIAAAATGDLWICALTTPDETTGFEVSWIEAGEGGAIPLRLRQRGDGLGMGGPRLFGRGSRQRSPRARGYL